MFHDQMLLSQFNHFLFFINFLILDCQDFRQVPVSGYNGGLTEVLKFVVEAIIKVKTFSSTQVVRTLVTVNGLFKTTLPWAITPQIQNEFKLNGTL